MTGGGGTSRGPGWWAAWGSYGGGIWVSEDPWPPVATPPSLRPLSLQVNTSGCLAGQGDPSRCQRGPWGCGCWAVSWLPQGRLKFLLVTQILTPTQCPQVPGTLGNSHRQHRRRHRRHRRHRRADAQTDAVLLRTRPQPGGPSPVMTARAQASPGLASRAHHAPSACPPDRVCTQAPLQLRAGPGTSRNHRSHR